MLYLFTENELAKMPESDLRAIIEASHRLAEAHKNYMSSQHQWGEGSIMVDSQLVSSWWSLTCVSLDREIVASKCWKAVYVAAIETQRDIESEVSQLWNSIAVIAELSDTDSLQSGDFWRMTDYVNDVIYDKSDQPRKDHAAFDKEFFRQKTNKSRVRICQKWAQANWTFGQPDFKKGK